ncbi:MAG TPA: hypothetical protein VI911_11565 [Patescibacteria group bacterium]|nr:hypothetical protein [Patescibacteria group bacterium]
MSKENGTISLLDILLLVKALDKLKKNSPEYNAAHTKAKEGIENYNRSNGLGKFSMSISKARDIIKTKENEEKRTKLTTSYKSIPKPNTKGKPNGHKK